jgi:hypothetical protein
MAQSDDFYADLRVNLILVLQLALALFTAAAINSRLLISSQPARFTPIACLFAIMISVLWIIHTFINLPHHQLPQYSVKQSHLSLISAVFALAIAPIAYFYEETSDDQTLKHARAIYILKSWVFFALSAYGLLAVIQSIWDSQPPWKQSKSVEDAQPLPGLIMILCKIYTTCVSHILIDLVFSNAGIVHIANRALTRIKPVTSIASRNEKELCEQLKIEAKHMKNPAYSKEKAQRIVSPSIWKLFVVHPFSNLILTAFLTMLLLASILLAFKISGQLILELFSKFSELFLSMHQFALKIPFFQDVLLKMNDSSYILWMKNMFFSVNEALDYILFLYILFGSLFGVWKSEMFKSAMANSSSEIQRAIIIVWLFLILFSSFPRFFGIFGKKLQNV